MMGRAHPPLVVYVGERPGRRQQLDNALGRDVDVLGTHDIDACLSILSHRFGVIVAVDAQRGATADLLQRCRHLAPEVVTLGLVANSSPESMLLVANDDNFDRCMPFPLSRETSGDFLLEAHQEALRRLDAHAMRLRDLANHRLRFLAHISESLIRAVNQPLSYMYNDTERLKQLSKSCDGLGSLVEHRGNELSPPDRMQLLDLSVELPGIVDDLHTGCGVIRDLSRHTLALSRQIEGSSTATPATCVSLALAQSKVESPRSVVRYEGPETLPPVALGPAELTYVILASVMVAGRQGGEVVVRGRVDGETVTLSVRHTNELDDPRRLRDCRLLLAAAGASLEEQDGALSLVLPTTPPEQEEPAVSHRSAQS